MDSASDEVASDGSDATTIPSDTAIRTARTAAVIVFAFIPSPYEFCKELAMIRIGEDNIL